VRYALTLYRWELEKLTAQWRVRAVFGVAVLAPWLFVAALRLQDAVPADTLFGRWVHLTGFATPLVVLVFTTQYALPLLISLVAGDIFAAEDRYGTWKTLLTRSAGRGAVFAGKALAAGTYTVVFVGLLACSSLAAGVVVLGHQPLVGLSGTLIGGGAATGLVLAAWASVLPAALAFAALAMLCSIATRNGPAAIIIPTMVGLLMQLASFVNGVDPLRHLLLTANFEAWHGFFTADRYYQPLVTSAGLSAMYLMSCLGIGYLLLHRRDFTEG
jgi:ABC-2 type transport system permease protein